MARKTMGGKPRGSVAFDDVASAPIGKRVRIACEDVVDHVPLDELLHFQGNLKSLSEENYKKLSKEITETGFAYPIHVWQDPEGLLRIVDGHQRMHTLKQLRDAEEWEIPFIPIVKVHAKDEAEARRRVLQGVSQYGQVEKQGLYEFMSLDKMDVPMLEASFSIPIADLNLESFKAEFFDAPEKVEAQTDEDSVPEVPSDPKVTKGDLFILGGHRLLCGDSTSVDDVNRLMNGVEADMVFTDPPWNVNYGGGGASGGGWKKEQRTIMNDHMEAGDWRDFCHGIAASLVIATKPGAGLYLVMSAQEWPVIDDELRKAGFHWSSTIIWAKDRLVLSRKDYHTQYEPIWYGWNDKASRLFPLEDRKQTDLWQFDRPSKSDLHPTTKPVELVERAILNSSQKASLILDLFGGSGSTLIAAEKTQRYACLMELDPKYCAVILNRWAEYTGKDPVREDGLKWSEIKGK